MKTKVREKSRYSERAGWMNRKISCVQPGRKECSNTADLVTLCGFSQPEKEKNMISNWMWVQHERKKYLDKFKNLFC